MGKQRPGRNRSDKRKQDSRRTDPRPSERAKRSRSVDEKVVGVNAVQAVFDSRREDIQRIYVLENRVKEFSALLKWAASARRPYNIVEKDEIERVSDSLHHEGICVVANKRKVPTLEDAIAMLGKRRVPELVLVLERVGNPSNIGAIVRTAAHFGVRLAIEEPADPKAGNVLAAARNAEGGLEHVDLVRVPGAVSVLKRLKKAGFTIIATSGHAEAGLYDRPLPAKTALVLGSERHGLSREAMKAADLTISIPGTGRVESLNVSAAAAVILAEHARLHHL